MKLRCVALMLMGLIALQTKLEARTLIGDLDNVEHGGYGAPAVRFTQIDGDFSVLSGGRGGWIINHRFVLGGGGYGLANPKDVTAPDATGDPVPGELEMGYGGGILEYIVSSDALVHISVELLVGAGGLTTAKHAESDAFFVTEPGANVMLNVTQFFRFGAGVSYRYTAGAHFGGLEDDDLTGASVGLIAKFGSF